jgi:hypothetical protein
MDGVDLLLIMLAYFVKWMLDLTKNLLGGLICTQVHKKLLPLYKKDVSQLLSLDINV